MLSPALLHRKRLELKAAGDAKGLAALNRQAKAHAKAAPEERAQAKPPTLAQIHRERAAGAASVQAAADAPANDNSAIVDPERTASPATIQRLAMAEDRRELKTLQSVEKRIERKRTLLPKYDAYVAGVIDGAQVASEQDPAFRAEQDDVVLNVLIWKLDVGDLHAGVTLFDFAQANAWQMPANFKRNLPTFVTEQAADFALQELDAGRPADLMSLCRLAELVRELDMPDEVRARLHKAIGREFARRADTPPAEGEAVQAGGRKARLTAALENLTRARDLDEKSGCKGDIQRLERELKKEAPAGDAPPAAPETPPSGQQESSGAT